MSGAALSLHVLQVWPPKMSGRTIYKHLQTFYTVTLKRLCYFIFKNASHKLV